MSDKFYIPAPSIETVGDTVQPGESSPAGSISGNIWTAENMSASMKAGKDPTVGPLDFSTADLYGKVLPGKIVGAGKSGMANGVVGDSNSTKSKF